MIAKDFILAGNATFTVSNPKGERYTFRVRYSKGGGGYKPAWFIYLLTEPDNTSSYTYMGMLNSENGTVRLSANSRYNLESLPVKVANWALRCIWSELDIPLGYTIQHAGKCGRCGRKLTVPSSIESGIGPECAKMLLHLV